MDAYILLLGCWNGRFGTPGSPHCDSRELREEQGFQPHFQELWFIGSLLLILVVKAENVQKAQLLLGWQIRPACFAKGAPSTVILHPECGLASTPCVRCTGLTHLLREAWLPLQSQSQLIPQMLIIRQIKQGSGTVLPQPYTPLLCDLEQVPLHLPACFLTYKMRTIN